MTTRGHRVLGVAKGIPCCCRSSTRWYWCQARRSCRSPGIRIGSRRRCSSRHMNTSKPRRGGGVRGAAFVGRAGVTSAASALCSTPRLLCSSACTQEAKTLSTGGTSTPFSRSPSVLLNPSCLTLLLLPPVLVLLRRFHEEVVRSPWCSPASSHGSESSLLYLGPLVVA